MKVLAGTIINPFNFFNDNPDFKSKTNEYGKGFQSAGLNGKSLAFPHPGPSYIDEMYLRRSLKNYDKNPLFTWLASRIGENSTRYLFNLYQVGTSILWGGSTVFW